MPALFSAEGSAAPWILRVGLAFCFLGHGMVALSIHEPWFAFYKAFGLSDDVARATMPVIGALDVVIAVGVIVFPVRALFVWCALWTFFTACLRPISGGTVFDVLVRASNWGPPVALLMASAGEPWLKRAKLRAQPRWLVTWLATATAFLVAGALMVGVLPKHDGLWQWLERGGVVAVPLAFVAAWIARRPRPRVTSATD